MEMERSRFPVNITMMLRDGCKVRLSGKKLSLIRLEPVPAWKYLDYT